MTSTLLVLLLSQVEGSSDFPAGDMLGLGQPGARHLYSGQVRWRFGHTLYALTEGGTLLFPNADGASRPGAYASLGLGVDNAR
ncbi:hypothetical protein JQX13_38400 [Archangium violaceum]|uniref:hypothetical protein n=1 Tax=Archangium violaceum TaxID=83451 RepID=UPI00193B10B3|nr:hypothetical protein [Archangium violaceum]QRK14239.1 hypothetical protein JQX13_38400 [Archangium violaceum]